MKITNFFSIVSLFLFASFLVAGSVFSATTATTVFSGFSQDLRLNTRSLDVLYLQKILNSNPLTRVATAGTGSPGRETKLFTTKVRSALVRFQKNNKINGENGWVGPKTRKVLNNLAVGLRLTTNSSNKSEEIVYIFEDDYERDAAIANYQKSLNNKK